MVIKRCQNCRDWEYETLLEKCWKCGFEKELKLKRQKRKQFYNTLLRRCLVKMGVENE